MKQKQLLQEKYRNRKEKPVRDVNSATKEISVVAVLAALLSKRHNNFAIKKKGKQTVLKYLFFFFLPPASFGMKFSQLLRYAASSR